MTEPRAFTKGHGTENDFVLVPDLEGGHDLTPSQVRWLADRHAGIGGDGVIRVVPAAAAAEDDVRAQAGLARWFMDYHNADGSPAQMCGNGARVLAAYLLREGLASAEDLTVATRSGPKHIRCEGDCYAVNLGSWRLAEEEAARANGSDCMVKLAGLAPLPGLSLDLGNPHTVVALPDQIDLDRIDLSVAPQVSPLPPHGTNIELVRPMAAGHIAMRVHERGVGETRSCGTGVAAAALATSWWAGEVAADALWRVDVPGGTLQVRSLPGMEVELSGPAVLVADGTVTLPEPT